MLKQFMPVGAALFLALFSTNASALTAYPDSRGGVEAQQQKSACKGIVKDASGEPIIGASVVVKGTTNGAVTNLDGQFTLQDVKPGATLQVHFMGYVSQEVKYTGRDLTVVLQEDTRALNELVVVGYGVQRKANLTGSVVSINAENIESRSVASVSAAMAGTMPGVTAIQNSGAPGSQKASITVRGKNSINAASPLVIVDGVPGSMDNIDPQDIEQLTVLKDAASAAIYGVQAANGVIVITTKKGAKGQKPRLTYSGTMTWVSPTEKLDFLGAADYATLYNEACRNDGKPELYSAEDIAKFRDGSDPYGHANTDWYKETFKDCSIETQHNLQINGGTDRTTYMFSLGYVYQDGLSKDKQYERFNGRMNVESQVTNWMKVGMNASASRGLDTDAYITFNQLMQYSNRIAPVYPIKNEDGTWNYSGKDNPVALQEQKTGNTDILDQQLNGTAYVDFTPIQGLSIKGLFSLRHDYRDYSRFRRIYDCTTAAGPREGEHNYYNWNWYTSQILINYNKSFGDHNFAALGGYEQQAYVYHYTTANRKGGGNDELNQSLNTLDRGSQKNTDGGYETARRSYFARLQYDYMNKYLFEFNVRADASSRFPKDNRWGYFPALSAGWRISEEAFIKDNADWISNLKLRLGWGKTGNEELKADDIYPAIATYAYSNTMLGGGLYTTTYEQRLINNDLKWATVTNYEIGLDAGFLNNMVGFELSLYKKKTEDMMLYLPIQHSIGMSAPAQNAGSVENVGFDLNVYHNYRINKDWSYNVGLNVAYVHNEITDMCGTEGVDPNNSLYWRLEGEAIGSFYGYKANGFFNTQEELDNYPRYNSRVGLGCIKFVDLHEDGKIDSNDRTVIGKDFPSWTTGLTIGVNYKNWDLNMLWQGAFDVNAYYTGEAAYAFFNGGKALEKHLGRWTPETAGHASYPRLTLVAGDVNYTTNSFWVADNSYVRLKNISLGYTLPKGLTQKVGIDKVKVYVSGENLLTFSHLDGIDPESPSNTRGAFYSNVKKISLGLKVSF